MENMEMMNAVVADPFAYARKLQKDTGRKIIGYMCSYAPEEIIFAAGAHPLRLFSSGRNILAADGHLQSYCCSLVRGVLENALTGNYDFLDGMIFPHTCDSVQRLSDIWRLNIPHGFHCDVVLPVKLDTVSARQYMQDVLRLFCADLEKTLQVKISVSGLRQSIALFNEIRTALQKLYALKNNYPEMISGKDLYTILKAAAVMERNDYLKNLQALIKEFSGTTVRIDKPVSRRLLLTGGVCSHPDVYTMIEEAGGTVVDDDLCTGARYFSGIIADTSDPIAALADRYCARAICPAKHQASNTRAENILQKVKAGNVAGVIFLLLKFCDPHAFDYPYLKAALDKAGIPNILIEIEDQLLAQGQTKTRIEAFLENL